VPSAVHGPPATVNSDAVMDRIVSLVRCTGDTAQPFLSAQAADIVAGGSTLG